MAMSEAGLARCRRMTIKEEHTSESKTWKLVVVDPRLDNKVVAEGVVHTEQDLARYKRAWMGKFRIPNENVVGG